MKWYKKWKRIGTRTKVALAGTALYAATLLSVPVYAAVKNEKVTEPINLEQVTTPDQAEYLYKEKLNEYVLDKELDSGEIRNLNNILLKEQNLFDKQSPQVEKYTILKKKTSKISNELSDLEAQLKEFDNPNNMLLSYLYERREQVEDLWETEYPGVIKKKDLEFNVVYSSDTRIFGADLCKLIKETIKELNSRITIDYNDSSLSKLLDQDIYEMKDVVKLLKVMKTYEAKLEKFNEGFIKKQELEQKIKELKLQKDIIWEKEMSLEQKNKIEAYINSHIEVSKRLSVFSDYTHFEDKAKKYAEKFGDRNGYWAWSVLAQAILEEKEGYEEATGFINNETKSTIEKSFNSYLKSQGLDARVKDLKNPRNFKFSLFWCALVNAFFFPLIRNILVKSYVGPRNEDEYMMSMGGACISWGVGGVLTDGLHPMAYWVRMASPLYMQPLKKLFKIKF